MRVRADMYEPQAGAVRAAVERGGKLAMFLDLGDGKTAATLHALRDLGAWPALVVAPASVVEADEWGREAAEWQDTRNLTVVPLRGTPDKRRWVLKQEPWHVETVSYDNLLWLDDEVKIRHRYRAIVFDELSKMKAPGTKRFKRMRRVAPGVDVRLGLTGHPTANHLLDLWAEMFLIAGPEPLGPTFAEYRDRWFKPSRYVQTAWGLQAVDYELRDRAALDDIRNRVRPWIYARPPSAPRNKPEVRLNVRRVVMPSAAERMSDKLMAELHAEFPNGATLEVMSGSQVGNKLRQIAGGAVYVEGTKWQEAHDAKLRALDDALDELQGSPALVFYWFKHEQERIEARLKRRGVRYSAGLDVAGWNNRKYEVMLVHPQSVAYGLNLQRGGHHALWYSAPWSYDLWMQGNGRLARPGQAAPWVTATIFECGPADRMVVEALNRKGNVEREFLTGL